MQYASIFQPPTDLQVPTWKRKKNHWPTYKKVAAPIEEARALGYDAWKVVDGKLVYEPNPVWDAAVRITNQRFDDYQRLLPLRPYTLHDALQNHAVRHRLIVLAGILGTSY